VPNHDTDLTACAVSWVFVDGYFQAMWTTQDVSAYRTLDFRVSRMEDSPYNDSEVTNFSIQLVHADGSLEAVNLSSYVGVEGEVPRGLRGPVGGPGVGIPSCRARIPCVISRGCRFDADQRRALGL
jgi:hypothetical protein